MIPVGINHVIRGWPWVTLSIIAICTLMQIYAVEVAPSREQALAMIDARIKDHIEHPDDAARDAQGEHDLEALADRIPAVRFGYPTGTGLNWRARGNPCAAPDRSTETRARASARCRGRPAVLAVATRTTARRAPPTPNSTRRCRNRYRPSR
jgi:hypothetical protein